MKYRSIHLAQTYSGEALDKFRAQFESAGAQSGKSHFAKIVNVTHPESGGTVIEVSGMVVTEQLPFIHS
jgi:hypothetical protein